MNAAHFHLVVNHLPLFAAMFGGMLLAAGLSRRSESLTRAGLMLGVVAGLGAGLASFSGERAEELVEGLQGVTEAAIEEHEEAAEITLWTGIAFGALSLLALLAPATRGRLARHTRGAALSLAVLTFVTAAWTANLGGRIRHPEMVESVSSGDTADFTEMKNDDRESGELGNHDRESGERANHDRESGERENDDREWGKQKPDDERG